MAKPKRLSDEPFLREIALLRDRVENLMFWLPPSGFRPMVRAIASISVDFPLPFSPTRKVTLG